MDREEYFNRLLELFEKHIEAKTEGEEDLIKSMVLTFIEKNPLRSNAKVVDFPDYAM